MTVLTSQLPSGGYGYSFPSVEIRPFTFLELNGYLENVPSDPLEKYVFDIKVLCKDDPKVYDLYVMDLDFLIFFKKLCTVSADLSYNLTIKCPDCGNMVKKRVTLDQDIHFTQIDNSVMDGAVISINNHKYSITMNPPPNSPNSSMTMAKMKSEKACDKKSRCTLFPGIFPTM